MKLVNETFFKHFCAGQDRDEVKPLMDSLKKLGVGGILDYAAEEDVSDATGMFFLIVLFSVISFSKPEINISCYYFID